MTLEELSLVEGGRKSQIEHEKLKNVKKSRASQFNHQHTSLKKRGKGQYHERDSSLERHFREDLEGNSSFILSSVMHNNP